MTLQKFDFDTVWPRAGTDSQKWQKYAGRDILPMWVADMDFRSPPAVLEALRHRVAHGIFGYARPTADEVEAVVQAMRTRYAWRIDPGWIVWLPGLVVGLNLAAQAFARPGEQVLCNTPVYPPFLTAPRNCGRETLAVPLAHDSAARRWSIDFDALAAALTPRTRLYLLCNPHNPVARAFDRAELLRLAAFCLEHRITLCSDEIHCDLILDEARRHTPVASLGDEIAAATVTLMAPSKTWNIPGLGTSFAIISDPGLRAAFVRASAGIVAEVNALGYAACAAAYRHGEPWRRALLARLRANRDLLLRHVERELPGVSIDAPIEATYLGWLNIAALGLADPVGHFERHGLGLSDGAPFGVPPGRNIRINFGCPCSTLEEGLRRLKAGVLAAGR
jgi:cystathionine beta-lyase